MSKRNITAVYIRGLAFKASVGGRRHQVLLNLKKADEKSNDLWAIKYALVGTAGFVIGGLLMYLDLI